MAAIEKICELSGDYEGHDMYRHKRNHIQVMPWHRKKFRGAIAVLHVFKPEQLIARFESGEVYSLSAFHPESMKNYEPPFQNVKEYISYIKRWEGKKLVSRFDFALVVDDEELMGEVDGIYMETTTSISAVKRRMKRMTRDYNIKVINHECTYHEWVKTQRP